MSVETVARSHQRSVNNITAAAVLEGDKAWSMVDVDNLDSSWNLVAPRATALVGAAQVAAAAQSDSYLRGLARTRGVDDHPAGRVNANGFRDFTAAGLPVPAFLAGSIYSVKSLIGEGWMPSEAYRSGRKHFANTITTAVGDQARSAVATSMGVRASGLKQGWVGGYVRQVSPGACSRCIILAGSRYQTAEAFERHPGCLCTHIPSAENVDDDPTTDPQAAFDAMSREDQDASFGKANAEAIRRGADMNQVVNATRRGGVYTAQGGRYTREGITRHGSYGRASTGPRATPETILKRATDPEVAVRLLKLYKYIL